MNELLRRLLFLPPQASTEAEGIDHLHYFVILTTMGGALFITIVGGVFLARYRRPPGAGPPPREDLAHQVPAWLEASAVALLLALFVGWWVIGFRQYLAARIPPPATLDVYVTAKQWMWQFATPGAAPSIADLTVPAGRPIKLVMTSRDVIHSFFVPDFRLKQDVLPGRYTTLWFAVKRPGAHQILCAEYCGVGHSTMRGRVIALAPADYARWLDGAPARPEPAGARVADPAVVGEEEPSEALDPVRLGEMVAAQQGCLRCHTLDGSPHIGPTFAGLYRSAVKLAGAATVVADEAYLTESMMDPASEVVAGYEPVMPSYQGRLRPEETAALIELIRSLRDVPGRPPPSAVGAAAPTEPALPPPGAPRAPPPRTVPLP